jgi:hypothetical protein
VIWTGSDTGQPSTKHYRQLFNELQPRRISQIPSACAASSQSLSDIAKLPRVIQRFLRLTASGMGSIDSHANVHVMRYQPCEAGVVDAAVNARSVCGGTVRTRVSAFVHIGVID